MKRTKFHYNLVEILGSKERPETILNSINWSDFEQIKLILKRLWIHLFFHVK